MRTWLAVGVALAVGVTPVFARGHSGGHGGGSHSGGHGGGSHSGGHGHAHSGGGGSHTSGGVHTHTRDGGSASSSHAGEHHGPSSSTAERSSSASAAPRPLTDAERRHPRPGTGTGDRFFDGFARGFYARPSFRFGLRYGGGYFDPFLYDYDYYGYSPWLYGAYGPYPSYRYQYDGRDGGALRIIVDPDTTRVYIDGYYAGIAGDLDGIFQRLRVAAGPHEITLGLEGYRTHRFEVFVPVGQTVKVPYVMVPGRGDDTGEDENAPRLDRPERHGDSRPMDRDRDDAEAATLRLDVRPPDASIYVDDQFRGTGREAERLELRVGPHRIEVVRRGYRTVARDVHLAPGEGRTLEIELEPDPR